MGRSQAQTFYGSDNDKKSFYRIFTRSRILGFIFNVSCPATVSKLRMWITTSQNRHPRAQNIITSRIACQVLHIVIAKTEPEKNVGLDEMACE